MLDKASVPRRALDFEDYVSIVRRNFRWILAPVFAGLVISTTVAYLMQDTYVSQALIRIQPQQISPTVVPEVTSQDLADRIDAMAQSIESHNTLSTIITSFGLYAKELKNEPMEDVVSDMKKAIRIRPMEGVTNVSGKNLPAMEVAFSYRDPVLAQKVCADIVTRFVNAHTQGSLENEQQAYAFINDQYQEAKTRFELAEQKLADFKTKNAGRLPEEVQSNLAQMTALQQRGASASDAEARSADAHLLLESQLAMAKDRLTAVKASSPQTQAQSQKVIELDREIDGLETQIALMKNKYTESFPDLQNAQDRLTLLKQQREDAFKEKPKSDSGSPAAATLSRERLDAEALVNQLQAQLKANEMESQRAKRASAQVDSALNGLQSRFEGLPAGEKEYTELLRDDALAKARYDELDQKRSRSATAIELNRRKQGETLELLDGASLPTTPSAPKRLVIIPMGAVVGLILGVLIVGMRELKDTSLKSLKDARLYTQLSVLGSIPLLENDVVAQRRKQVMWVGWAAATFVGLAVMAGSVVHYYLSKA